MILKLEIIFQKWGALLYFIDHYVDILDYKDPNKKYFYSIENIINKERYSINHINFNPSSIITNNGVIFDHNKEEISYTRSHIIDE